MSMGCHIFNHKWGCQIRTWKNMVKPVKKCSLNLYVIPLSQYLSTIKLVEVDYDRLCGLLARVSGYRSRGLGFDSRLYQMFWEVSGLEGGPLSLVRTND
jgi:hypothetical protein